MGDSKPAGTLRRFPNGPAIGSPHSDAIWTPLGLLGSSGNHRWRSRVTVMASAWVVPSVLMIFPPCSGARVSGPLDADDRPDPIVGRSGLGDPGGAPALHLVQADVLGGL